MYSVNRLTHEVHGRIVSVDRSVNGEEKNPFDAVQRALTERFKWKEAGAKNVKLFIDGQIMTTNQAEQWSDEEYKSLPKCKACAKILIEELYTHRLCPIGFFCSQQCADLDFYEEMEKVKDEEDVEYL